jgi:hypothetical protein
LIEFKWLKLLSLKSSAKKFGLVDYKSDLFISVTENWIDIFHSEDLARLKKARKQSIKQPSLYKQILEQYKERQLPKLDKLSRELHLNPQYGILQDVAENAAKIFLESAKYAEIINSNGYITIENDVSEKENLTKDNSVFEPHSDDWTTEKIEYLEQGKNHGKQELGLEDENKISYFGSNIHPGEDLEKYEITLVNQEKAYIYVPVPLPFGEKERLKKYIDLIIEDPSNNLESFSHFSNENPRNRSL